MIAEDTLRTIAHIFCGDMEEYFSYKTGPKLVGFFNSYFKANDVYTQGFPSRWIYVYNKLVEMINQNQFDQFLNVILSKEYLMKDMDLSQVLAVEHSQKIFNRFNEIFNKDLYKITLSQGKYRLIEINSDLIKLGNGGFANVFKQKSTGLVIKQLKDDFLSDVGIRSRFKREFEITKSLSNLYGIIEVYSFDKSSCSYTMELAEKTLEDYILMNTLNDDIRISCIRQILYIMTQVHKKDVIHRDLSPNNIFLISGQLKIADFGLGKDLNVFTSHQTLNTNSVGQYYYCAPEQFMMLRDGDKRSDIYSLGRIINFIMTGKPTDSHHMFRSVAEKATNSDASYRFADAEQLSAFFEKSVAYHKKEDLEKIVTMKIGNGLWDEMVESFIYELSAEKLSELILSNKADDALLHFMSIDDAHATFVMQSVDSGYVAVCGNSFASYDAFARFSYNVLIGTFPYVIKEIAANILRCVAKEVNRFYAQHLIDDIKKIGIESTLEEILDS